MERIFPLQLPVGKITALNLQEILNEEKLLRLHPHWRIETLNREEQVLRVLLTDYATEQELRLGLRLDLNVRPDILMRITLVDNPIATVDLVADTNGLAARVQAQSLDEDTERNLLLWLRSIQAYLLLYHKKTPIALFQRLVMDRMILQMNPSQRKICMMISKITAVELLVILIIVIGYVVFMQ
jgi:hypothetical protein